MVDVTQEHSDRDSAQDETSEAAPADTSEDTFKALQTEVSDLKDRLLRALAETENVRRRAERERKEAEKYGIAPLARDLIVVADNLARALKSVPQEQRAVPAVKTLMDGVELTERDMLAAFERHGIKRIVPKGEAFNPNFHQAVAEVPVAGVQPGTVVEVIEAGFVIDERLIRPAMVVIARSAEAAPGSGVDTTA